MKITKTIIAVANKVTEYEAIIIEHEVNVFEIVDTLRWIVKENGKITMSDILFILLVKHQEHRLGEIKVLEKQYFRSEQSLCNTTTMQNSKSYIMVKQDNKFVFKLEEPQN